LNNTKFSQINVIPFIDIMLVLLVIVLMSATFLNSSISVDLPNSKSSKTKELKNPKEILINSDNNIYFDGILMSNSDLEHIIKSLPKDQKYLIRGDKNSHFNSFIQVIDIFKSNDISNVSIITKSK